MKSNTFQITVDIEPISRRLFYTENETFYELLINSGIRVQSLCGGKGTCGKCKILVQDGMNFLNPPTNSEMKFLTQSEIREKWRLACQCRVNPSQIQSAKIHHSPQIRIFIPKDLLGEDFKILTSGKSKKINLNPNVKKIFIEINKPNLENPVPDIERILSSFSSIKDNEGIYSDLSFEIDTIRKIPLILREEQHRISLTVYNNKEVIDCEAGNKTEDYFGIAFDIGTTTIVGYLINLHNGKIYSIASALNPQTAYGEDVISRITYIKDNPAGLGKLNSILIESLNSIIKETCNNANVSTSQIYEATIVGNSVMHHIFLNINPTYIGLSPYVPALKSDLNIKAKDVNLEISKSGYVYVLPVIAGFVGADTMGVIISSEIDKEQELTLAIDVGTNGELVIGNKDALFTGSCAAGSALEGAHIQHGMRAASGAIDTLKINPSDFSVEYTTINNKKPIGFCGSGIIDTVAEMLRAKLLTRSGNFNKEFIDNERIIKEEKNLKFILVNEDDTPIKRHITISQSDVRELQMAKGAFYSGARLILNHLNSVNNSDLKIKQILLAGAFGNYINKNNAKFIGMIPDIPDDKLFQIGNAAGVGAQNCLLNIDLRKKARKLQEKIQYVEIAVEKDFQKEFASAMYFPHLNLNLFPSLKEYAHIPKR
ncbi:MAG: ASKHA domain-containing protein [Promethearchaeota archaeon]